eukprot:CAMPEP_0115583984 /NCGR_PEP_ID=MMETSP0272-20121206/6452_1 /TAXON_ID=71861 /ORGANISM="Scrippsiella trochoidea, Strain CCMP3099" /LENGTH=87 /DNA_ID=CAMNT_0003019009 /DNA_START=9 /DNA_END=269 /DNA_ORIENTATION=+
MAVSEAPPKDGKFAAAPGIALQHREQMRMQQELWMRQRTGKRGTEVPEQKQCQRPAGDMRGSRTCSRDQCPQCRLPMLPSVRGGISE